MSVLRAVSSVWCCSVAAALVGVAVPSVASADEGASVPGKSAESGGEKECEKPKPEPKRSDNIWPGDLDSCDKGFDLLCARSETAYIVGTPGVASLAMGLTLTIRGLGNSGNKGCDGKASTEPCDGETGPHGLYGEVETSRYVDASSGARSASDGILYGSIGLGSLTSVLWGRRHAVAFASSLGYTLLTTELLKLAVSNPRPIAWMTKDDLERLSAEEKEAALEEQHDEDSYRSFPSGHTSMTAAATSSIVTIWTMHLLEIGRESGDYTAAGVVAGVGGVIGAGLTVGVGSLRVAGGKHHQWDVFFGGLIGTTFGVLVPIGILGPSRNESDNPRGAEADILDPSTFALGVDDSQVKLSGQW